MIRLLILVTMDVGRNTGRGAAATSQVVDYGSAKEARAAKRRLEEQTLPSGDILVVPLDDLPEEG